MTIYIDSDYKCHVSSAEGRRSVETDAFDGKCRQYIEGYRFVPDGEVWTRSDGVVFRGEMVTSWRDYALLSEFQAQYEEMLAERADMQAALDAIYGGDTGE